MKSLISLKGFGCPLVTVASTVTAKAVLISGTHLSKPGTRAACMKAVTLAKENRARIILDIDYRPNLWGLAGHAHGALRFMESPEVTAMLGDLLPLGGISRVTTVFCNETGRYMIYDADERGFNNPRGIWPGREADILALGDSFTHGVCVDPAKGYMALIRAAVSWSLAHEEVTGIAIRACPERSVGNHV